jgi:tripartite-type tricarboxylate transporter receptor subunit TctC
MIVAGKKDSPFKDFKEFLVYAKANPGKLNYGTGGVGATSHLTCLFLDALLGAPQQHVPFRGSGPALNALIAGQVDYMTDQIVNAVPQIKGNTIKVYAIGTPERNPALPDVPTSKEAGLPGFQASAWNALFAPKGTPKPVLDKLSDALSKALDDQNTRKRLLDLGSDIPDGNRRGQQALATLVKSEIAKWTPIIKAAGTN